MRSGPAGEPGLDGEPGEPGNAGATGPTGPSNAWVGAAGSDTTVSGTNQAGANTVVTTTITLAGPVLVTGTLNGTAQAVSYPLYLTCFIANPSGTNIGSAVVLSPPVNGYRPVANVTVQASATVTTVPAAFTLRCHNSSSRYSSKQPRRRVSQR